MRSNPYNQENLRHGAFHYLMGRGAAGAAGFLTVLLLVRFMDLHNYAAYTALSGIAAMCGVLAGLGMERVVSRYVPDARLHHSVADLSRFIWITSAVRLLAALLVVALLFAFWPLVDQFLAVTEFKGFSVGLACFISAETMFQHFSSVLQSLVMQKTLTRLLVIQWAGRLLLIAAVVFIKSGIDWHDALWIFAIPELLGVIAFVVVIKQHLHNLHAEHNELSSGRWPQWGQVARIGLHNFGFTLLAAPPQGYFMKVLTAAYLPVEVVAAYGFFLSVAEKARQYIPLHFFYGLLEPMMIAGYLKDRDFSALSYRCQLLYKSNLLLMVPAIAWVAVAGDPIVGLMTGGKFQGLSWILVLVMVQLTIGSHVVLLQLLLNSLEKSKILFTASLVALPGLLLAMAVSIVTSPIWLLCTPIVFSLVMNLYIVFHLARSRHPYKPSWKMLGSVSVSGLVAFATVKLLSMAGPLSTSSLVTAITALFGVMTAYLLVIWVSKAIDKSEIGLIKDILLNIRQTKAGT
jgi:O-antigen/teichoic acid export membrane protein